MDQEAGGVIGGVSGLGAGGEGSVAWVLGRGRLRYRLHLTLGKTEKAAPWKAARSRPWFASIVNVKIMSRVLEGVGG